MIIHGDCLGALAALPDRFARLAYIDPPFNTGSDREIHGRSYDDEFDDYEKFLMPRIESSLHCLTNDGSIFVHLDHREVHYVKVWMDRLLGRDKFMNEIIWSFDYGGRSKRKWPAKHNTILWFTLDPKNYIFNYDAIDRIPYMAPNLVGKEKAARGKTPTDVWWSTIVHTTGHERVDYPTQKPMKVLERIVNVHSNPNDTVLDFFAGSGTTGHAAAKNDRSFVLVDSNEQAIDVMKKRLERYEPNIVSAV